MCLEFGATWRWVRIDNNVIRLAEIHFCYNLRFSPMGNTLKHKFHAVKSRPYSYTPHREVTKKKSLSDYLYNEKRLHTGAALKMHSI